MSEYASSHAIFNPSESWIHRAGVKLKYTPEDTLKSAIFQREEIAGIECSDGETIRISTENNNHFPTEATTTKDRGVLGGSSEVIGSQDGSLPLRELQSSTARQCDDSTYERAPGSLSSIHTVPSGGSSLVDSIPEQSKKSGTRRKVPAKPAPFLKRRQGMAAWCSKIRRQGLPVRDPAHELQNKRRGIITEEFPRNCSLGSLSSSAKTSSLDRAPVRSEGETVSSCKGPAKKQVNDLWCGLVHRRRANSLVKGENESRSGRDGGDFTFPPPPCTFNGTFKAVEFHTNPSPRKLNDSDSKQMDVGDLEEFEMLEEMAENSSFSSITTSFVSKLGRTCLKDRIRRAEDKLGKLTATQSADCDGSNAVSMRPSSCARDDLSSGAIQTLKRSRSERVPERSILPILDKYRSQHTSERYSAGNSDRATDSILADLSQVKTTRKVSRLHIVQSCSPAANEKMGDVSPPRTLRELDTHYVPKSSLEKCDGSSARGSVEFDDANSWSGSGADLSNSVGKKRLSPALDVPSPDRSSQPSPRQPDVVPEAPPVQTERQLFRPEEPTKSNPSSTGHTLTTVTRSRTSSFQSSPVRRLSRPSSSRSPSASKSPCAARTHCTPSYEDELITLADDMVNQLRREPSATSPIRPDLNTPTALRQWIHRLESEVRRFKVENASLTKMKSEREESMRRLEQETKRFELYKAKEAKAFNEYKEAEMRKIRKERRVLDEYSRALKSTPSRKDREEIDRLKEELQESRNEINKREVRWHAAMTRLRSRIEELESERDQLKTRINRLLEERINLQERLTQSQGNVGGSVGSRGSQGRPTLSSTSSLRQSSKPSSEDSIRNRSPENARRIKQQQYVSSCRLSNRPNSHISGGHLPLALRSSRSTTSSTPGRVVGENSTIGQTPRREPSIASQRASDSGAGTRESLNSGGYFTGDDESVSVGSAGRSEEKGNKKLVNEGDVFGRHTPGIPPALSPLAPSSQDSSKVVVPAVSCSDESNEQLPVPGTAASGTILRTVKHPDGSREQTYSNGAVVVSYANGSVKEVFPGGTTVVVSLFNGDIKRTLPDGRVIYHYAADGTVQITYPNGTEEINYADGRQEVIHPGRSENKTTDRNRGEAKTVQFFRRLPNGDREINLPNGQREVHSTSGVKCRIYPDGTTKTVFPDGRHETRYASGRLRVKDAQGNLVLDTRLPPSTRGLPLPPGNLPTSLQANPMKVSDSHQEGLKCETSVFN
ncbi:unnamed protein product [Calicophoron daubneyi]|uniref:Centromere protein J C-terminal domain-containing protein n=1 Tax=Calicophoron daubneyi TaxID=300641 RepID=A0AAV2SZV4_CALDB